MLPVIVAETPALEQHIARIIIRIVQSSASYKAHRIEASDKFLITRSEHDGFPGLTLGTCTSEERAERFLDWWVLNDRRVQRSLQLTALNQETTTIIDLMVEAARSC